MNEYLSNIRFIKMYSWEKPLSKFLAGASLFIQSWKIIFSCFFERYPLHRQTDKRISIHGLLGIDYNNNVLVFSGVNQSLFFRVASPTGRRRSPKPERGVGFMGRGQRAPSPPARALGAL